MALKSILKNTEAGPSRTKGSKAKASVSARVAKEDAPKSKGKAKTSVSVPKKDTAKGKGVRIDAPVDSSDDNDFGDDDEMELDTDEEIERAQAPGEKRPQSELAAGVEH